MTNTHAVAQGMSKTMHPSLKFAPLSRQCNIKNRGATHHHFENVSRENVGSGNLCYENGGSESRGSENMSPET